MTARGRKAAPEVRAFIERHSAGAVGLAALAALLQAKADRADVDPSLDEKIRALLRALGLEHVDEELSPADAAALVAELRHTLLHCAKLASEVPRTGWTHDDPALLQSVGDFSAGFIHPLTRGIVPALDGLAARLASPKGAFLDVGVGVAGLAIAAARAWPNMRVVGLDSWEPALALARANVAKAGLEARIELRRQAIEDLEDEGRFDLAWIPTSFLAKEVVRPACTRVLDALRPGGWMVLNAVNTDARSDALTTALWDFRLASFGSGALPKEDAVTLLCDLGATEVRALSGPAGAFLAVVAGRKGAR